MFNSSLEFNFNAANESGHSQELTNGDVARGLERIAELLPPSARREVLRRAASAIRYTPRPVTELVAESSVEGVHALGINYELSGVITDWIRSGRLPWLEALETKRRRELISLPGIGPKLARELREVLGITDLEGLKRAVKEGTLPGLCGIGPKRLKTIEAVLGVRAATSEASGAQQLELSAA